MARTRKNASGRGSAQAVEKRRAARQLNAVFSGKSKQGRVLDGRTEKRRKRLLKELKEGKGGNPLKAIDMVSHTDELLQLGETLTSIRKNGVKTSKVELPQDIDEVIERTQAAYGFDPRAWSILGYKLDSAASTPEAGPKQRSKKTSSRPRKGRSKKTG